MNNTSELLYTYFTNPREAIRYVLDHPPTVTIFLLFFFALFNGQIAESLYAAPFAKQVGLVVLFGFLFKVIMTILLLFIFSAFVHFFADLFGTTGSVTGLFMTFMLSLSPFIFAAPIAIVSPTFFIKISLLLILWSLILQIKGIQEVYRISVAKALIAYFLPIGIVFIVVPLLIVELGLAAIFLKLFV